MKIILRVIMILLTASVIAGAFYLAVDNSFIASSTNEGGQPSAMTSAEGQSFPSMERPEGDDHVGGSITQGLSGVLATLMKLTGITIFCLLLQKASHLVGNHNFAFTER